MAAKVLDVFRARKIPDYSGDGHAGTNGHGHTNADHLIATVDIDGDGRRVVNISVREADHAGLMAEFAAGTPTTIQEAAIEAEVQAIDDVSPATQGNIRADILSSTQKSNLILKAVTWPAP